MYIYIYTSIYVNHLEIEIVMICHDEPVDGFWGVHGHIFREIQFDVAPDTPNGVLSYHEGHLSQAMKVMSPVFRWNTPSW